MPQIRERLQTALSAAYDIERELPSGGMARVFVARERRLERRVVIKVLSPELAADISGARFEREIQLAAALHHPHVVGVLAAGEADGLPFYTMPFVDGASLRDRLAAGPVPRAEALRILRDVAAGLAYAHARGVVHRDVKPENVLLGDGFARVADFGLAKALDVSRSRDGAAEPERSALTLLGTALGTPAYIAPEQAVGDAVDARADVYAWGVVAWELLAHRHPFAHRATAQQLVAAHVGEPAPELARAAPDVPAPLAALVMRCLSKDRDERPSSAAALVDALGALGARRRRPGAGATALAAVALLALAGGAAARFGGGRFGAAPAASSQARVAVLLTDFRSPPDDSLLGGVMSEALRTSLGQSHRIALLPREAVRGALARMRRDGTTRVDLALAREVAVREGAAMVVDGAVDRVGGTYVLTARLVAADADAVLAEARETAPDERDVIPAIERVAHRLRAAAGEPRGAARAAAPLEQVTTSSLEALRRYTESQRAIDERGDYAKAVALLEEATALDTAFAMAYRRLGLLLREPANFGGSPTRAAEALARAYAHRHRLTEVERNLTTAAYFSDDARFDPAKAIAAYEAVLAVQPEHPGALNNIGTIYTVRGDYRTGCAYAERALRSDTMRLAASSNVVNCRLLSGDTTGAMRALDAAARRHPSNPTLGALRVGILTVLGRYAESDALARASLESAAADAGARARALNALALNAIITGRPTEGERLVRRRAETEGEVPGALMEALIAAHDDVRLRGRPERAVERVERLLREPRVRSQPATQQPLEFAIPILAEAGRPARARALLERLERALTPQAAARREAELHVLRGTIALAEGRTPEAIDELTQGSRGECRACALPLLARAYERAGAPDSAVAVLQRYLATPDFSRTYVDAAYLAEIHQRLGALHEAQGRRREAAASYQRLVALWRDAEPELQPVVREARAHAARLLAGDGGPRVPVLRAGAR